LQQQQVQRALRGSNHRHLSQSKRARGLLPFVIRALYWSPRLSAQLHERAADSRRRIARSSRVHWLEIRSRSFAITPPRVRKTKLRLRVIEWSYGRRQTSLRHQRNTRAPPPPRHTRARLGLPLRGYEAPRDAVPVDGSALHLARLAGAAAARRVSATRVRVCSCSEPADVYKMEDARAD
jgi:hypothetical protein